MYLGFFFIHWSSTKSGVVYTSEPQPIDICPFCNTNSSVIVKIHNIRTKHWSWLELGDGDYEATFTCRNCTNEGGFENKEEQRIIKKFKYNIEFYKIVELHKKKPEKASIKLQKLINGYRGNGFGPDEMYDKMLESSNNWNTLDSSDGGALPLGYKKPK